jgi:hypothetical protein
MEKINAILKGKEVQLDASEVVSMLWSQEFKDLMGNEIEHIKNHFEKITLCDIYGWNQDDEFIKYFDVCERGNK